VAHVDTVKKIYQAFGEGDIATILDQVADNVEWEYGINSTQVPWLQPRKGRARVPEFFQALGEMEIKTFQPRAFFASDSTVLVLLDLDATVRATGRRIVEEDEVHVWHFDAAGRVSRFRHRVDTHQHQTSLR